MPKGRMGILGPGPFYRVRLPKVKVLPQTEGQKNLPPKNETPPPTEEQKKLLALVEIKSDVLNDLTQRRPSQFQTDDNEHTWEAIIHAVGDYLGMSKLGPPPTQGERDKALAKITKAAEKLEAALEGSHFHVTDFLHKAMLRQKADLYELKKQLGAITDPMPVIEEGRQPKGRPDPYKEILIRDLIEIWTLAVGEPPSKTGTDHYKDERTSPFFLWANRIAEVGTGKTLPRDLVDTVIGLSRPDYKPS